MTPWWRNNLTFASPMSLSKEIEWLFPCNGEKFAHFDKNWSDKTDPSRNFIDFFLPMTPPQGLSHICSSPGSRQDQNLSLAPTLVMHRIVESNIIESFPGVKLLPQGHEGWHLRAPEQEGLQRTPGLPAGQRRLPQSPGHALHHDPLGPWRSPVSHWREHWQLMLHCVR